MLRIASVSYIRNTNLGRMTNFSDTVLKCPVVFLTALDRSKTVPPLVVASWETRYTAPRSCVGAQSLGDEPSLSKHRDDLRMQDVRRRAVVVPSFPSCFYFWLGLLFAGDSNRLVGRQWNVHEARMRNHDLDVRQGHETSSTVRSINI